jgi:hypothetical protein
MLQQKIISCSRSREAATESFGDSKEPFSAAALSESSGFRDDDSSDKGS